MGGVNILKLDGQQVKSQEIFKLKSEFSELKFSLLLALKAELCSKI